MKITLGQMPGCGDCFYDLASSVHARRSQRGAVWHKIKVGLGIGLVASVIGCVGVVDDGYGGAVVVAPEPDVYFFGDYGGRRDWHGYSHRGAESRGAAHHGGGGHGGDRH
jgi:hypothetical protein